MSDSRLIRWSGAALLVGGALYAVASPLHPDDNDPNGLLNPLWTAVHLSHMLTFTLVVFGLTGLYLRLAERTGRLGLAALLLAQVGSALTIPGIVFEALAMPVIAAQGSGPKSMTAFLDPSGPYQAWAAVLPLVLTGLLLWAAGFILVGVATMRSGILPRTAGLLLLLGTVLSLPPVLPVKILGAEASAVALVWLGYALWTDARPAARPSVAGSAA